MASRSYRIGYNFQRRVTKHLVSKGFNCITQPKSAFPDIIAWKPFVDGNGNALAINVQETLSDKTNNKVLFPFYISFIECKVNKYLSKKEKEAAKLILKEGRCNSFLVAYRDVKKLLFQEITLDNENIIINSVNKKFPSYIG